MRLNKTLARAISIHALREEGDRADGERVMSDKFYPRPPRGGRRQTVVVHQCQREISIHALREEGDRLPL